MSLLRGFEKKIILQNSKFTRGYGGAHSNSDYHRLHHTSLITR